MVSCQVWETSLELFFSLLESTNKNEVNNLNFWNPMEEDFLSNRNNYKIDDEDASLALEGYSKLFLLRTLYMYMEVDYRKH